MRPAVAYVFDYRTDSDVGGDHRFEGEDAPRGTAISYYLKSATSGGTLSILDAQGRTLCTSSADGSAGLHRVQWTLVTPAVAPQGGGRGGAGGGAPNATDRSCSGNASRGPGTPLAAGTYTAKLTIGGKDYVKPVTVLEDVWLNERR